MGRRIVIDAEQQAKWKDLNIVYPFCIKYGSEERGYTYCRHLEDGRYEHLCCEPLKMHFSYGNQVNHISGLLNNDEYWYKQLANLHTVITSEEFETARADFFGRYQNYMLGTEFIAKDVQKMLANTTNHYETKVEKEIQQISDGGIIINNGEETPF